MKTAGQGGRTGRAASYCGLVRAGLECIAWGVLHGDALAPEHAHILKRDGLSKADVKRALFTINGVASVQGVTETVDLYKDLIQTSSQAPSRP